MARTFHSLTFSLPEFDPDEHGGPRINVLFTNLSKFAGEPDNIMIPGTEPEGSISNMK